MKRKILRILKYIGIIVLVIVALYFAVPIILGTIVGSYNRYSLKNRIAEKLETKRNTYYISASGNDNNDGKTIQTAWKTITKINSIELNPGDSVLFEANKSFAGTIELDKNDLGTAKKPVTICSYGAGKATINGGNGFGIEAKNTQGFHISNLFVKGSGQGVNEKSGIAFINDMWGDIQLDYLLIDSVEAAGFGYWGILIDGAKKKSGFSNVTIESCAVHDNGDAGLYVYGEYNYFNKEAYAHKNVSIRRVKAYNNAGRPKSNKNTGSGIVLSDTNKGLIEQCVAYNNGALCHAKQGGPVGIWAWDSKDVVIQYNESYNNKTGGIKDGGGFDLDGGMVNSILQYNYSHDNEGTGFFLAQFSWARKHSGNIIRYNISNNDGRKNDYAAIEIWGECENACIYNNTVFLSSAQKSKPSVFIVRPNDELGNDNKKLPSNIIIANNIFLSEGDVPLVKAVDATASIKLINNNYYNLSEKGNFFWNGKQYSSLNDWRDGAAQEKDGTSFFGFNVNPEIGLTKKSDALPTLAQNESLSPYQLNQGSKMINAGVDVAKLFKIKKEAVTDINKTKLPQESKVDIGALEYIQTVQNN